MPHTLLIMNAACSALNRTATMFNISRVHLTACSALHSVTVMLYAFGIAGAAEPAPNGFDLLFFLRVCYLALVPLSIPLIRGVLPAGIAAGISPAAVAAGRAGLLLSVLRFLIPGGIGARTDFRRISSIAVIRKSRACCE
jgi:hypothetical protein